MRVSAFNQDERVLKLSVPDDKIDTDGAEVMWEDNEYFIDERTKMSISRRHIEEMAYYTVVEIEIGSSVIEFRPSPAGWAKSTRSK